MNNVLEINNITKDYKKFKIDNISFKYSSSDVVYGLWTSVNVWAIQRFFLVCTDFVLGCVENSPSFQ